MINDLICYNGKMMRWSDTGLNPDSLLTTNFVYQKIHAFEHTPLNSDIHVEIINKSFANLYGTAPELTSQKLVEESKKVLSENRYPLGSAILMLYLFPPHRNNPEITRILSCERQLLYKKYTLWHSSMKGMILTYEPPFSAYKTAISLSAHNYAEHYARQNSADVVLTESFDAVITSVGEHPFFAIKGQSAYTTPLADRAVDSVERRMGISACEKWGNGILQVPIQSESIGQFDEMFFVTPQGIVSIGELNGALYPNSAANAIMRHFGI